MAKASMTAMEIMVSRLQETSPLNIDTAELLRLERQQIESAFNAGESGTYGNADHYYFMEYIDND